MNLQLVDLVGPAARKPVPPCEVVVNAVLRGVLDEDQGDADGLETLQNRHLTFNFGLPRRLGLGLQLESPPISKSSHLLL